MYSSATVFNVSAVQTFVQNNMGTLTSIVEQVWSLFKGNIGFLFDTCLGIIKIILNSGSGVVNSAVKTPTTSTSTHSEVCLRSIHFSV